MEAWDGPALVTFTDGRYIGATLDRNGLRPGRYYLTKNGRVIMASEVGVIDVPAKDIVMKGRLKPGNIFLVDFDEHRVVDDDEVKLKYSKMNPYGDWLKRQAFSMGDVFKSMAKMKTETTATNGSTMNGSPTPSEEKGASFQDLLPYLRTFGFNRESLDLLLVPMAIKGAEPLGSMGNDAALACMSERPKLLSEYFRELFAQVSRFFD